MPFATLDLIRDLVENSLLGHTWLVGLIIIFLAVVILLVCRVYPEVALLIPSPLLIAFAEAGIIPFYFKGIVYILAGVYLATMLLIMFGISRR